MIYSHSSEIDGSRMQGMKADELIAILEMRVSKLKIEQQRWNPDLNCEQNVRFHADRIVETLNAMLNLESGGRRSSLFIPPVYESLHEAVTGLYSDASGKYHSIE